jgi:hypothetical protein
MEAKDLPQSIIYEDIARLINKELGKNRFTC